MKKLNQEELNQRAQSFFTKSGILNEGVEVVKSNVGFSFYALHDRRYKEICSICFSLFGKFDSYINYYTTSADSDFELDRLEMIGRLANYYRNNKQEIENLFLELEKNTNKVGELV